MRLWSLHPTLLDRAALVACWREALLAQKVLRGETKGYRHHPQLERFRSGKNPEALIAAFLAGLADEADARGYQFDRTRILSQPASGPALVVTTGQLDLELDHLRDKVATRAPGWAPKLNEAVPHPLFRVVSGPVASWERARRIDS
nr:pyrimidine dimer DNA glycosylase/endonuclease V [Pseudoclavibacter sp. Marseille-Q3772]